MKTLAIRFFSLTLFFISLGGCVSTSLISDIDPNTDLDALQSLLVLKLPADNRGIEQLIAAELTKRGKTAKAASSKPNRVDADAIVTYEDKWMG